MTSAERGPAVGMQFLCVCADDFGMSAGINAAIVDLAREGKISATGCMVKRSAWTAGARALQAIDPSRLDVGLHLDFGVPPPGATADRRVSGLILRSYLGLLDRDTVTREIRMQLDHFEQGIGRPPAFVDGHQHIHQLPTIREALLHELARRYRRTPPWIRGTAPPMPSAGLKGRLIFALGGAAMAASAARAGLPLSDCLLGVYDFSDSRQEHEVRLASWIAQCRTGDVLMCHPSMGDVVPDVPHASARLNEYLALASVHFPMQMADGVTVSLVPFSRVQRLRRGGRNVNE